ncbi:MAG: c-type cytochrome [Gemmatimonadales bacterium]
MAALFLLAGCGDQKGDAGAAADTTSTPAAAPAPDPAPADTAARADMAAPKPSPTEPEPRPAAKPAPKPEKTVAAAKPTPATPDTATQTVATDAPLRDAYHQAPRDTVSQEVYEGWKQFNLNCARCHGEDVTGTTIAPHLILSLKPDGPINTRELFISTVCAGRPAKGMPAWCSLGLEMDKIQEIYSYVKGRSDAKIAPGRPAVKPAG